ncbi:MAG: cobalamin-independent methionine synthase II family protein [Alphaproteobacteria bacterium]|nr:cobalamin-independent methionine synthase II family protein [Alphaproteobacteria bacterium]
MKHSTDHLLVTHVGSLPRPPGLVDVVVAREKGQAYDSAAYEALLARSVADVVARQAALGIDIVDDGEYGKPGFMTYVNERLGGFAPASTMRGLPWEGSRESLAFPEFYTPSSRPQGGGKAAGYVHLECVGPITYQGHALLARDLANFRKALAAVQVTEAFVPAISPANVEDWQTNRYYRTDEDYLYAIAEALRVEYLAIVEAGFLLQVDDPLLATYYCMHPEADLAACRKWADQRVEALNHALRGIPEDRIRYHTCYSINMGPRVHDMELKDIVDIILKIRAGSYSFEAGNPRHDHEWKVWKTVKVPAGKILIPGVISHSTILVEHPELIADRLLHFADAVGRENVIAGADCGFGSFATSTPEVMLPIVWAKFAAMVEGARIASKQLWGRA